MLDLIQKNLLREVSELDGLPTGAYNLRSNGQAVARHSTANVEIIGKEDKPGIDICIKPGTKHESVHIPVILSESGLKDLVYNDFHVGEGSDVVIIAGCGIHNCGGSDSVHDGIHTFYIGKNARLRYIEKHFGEGDGAGKRLMNPTTIIYLEEGATMEMESTQIAGVDDAIRKTTAVQAAGSTLEIQERILTTGTQRAESHFTADLNGSGCSCNIISHAVARESSYQYFSSVLNGKAPCAGHTACDSIIMDHALVVANPQLSASCEDASLIHEAAIGKIAGDQLIKLMTLGLTEQEAEEQVIAGFLR